MLTWFCIIPEKYAIWYMVKVCYLVSAVVLFLICMVMNLELCLSMFFSYIYLVVGSNHLLTAIEEFEHISYWPNL